MILAVRASVPVVLALLFGLACGGGGSSGATTAATTATATGEAYYYVRYKEPLPNAPTLEAGEWSSAVSNAGLTGNFDTKRTLQAGARANPADLPPDLLLILKKKAPAAQFSGNYNAIVYGLFASQVTSGQFLMEFSTSPAAPYARSSGITNSNSQPMLGELPSGSAWAVDAAGNVTWGGWKGAVDGGATTLLLHKDKLLLLGSKRADHADSEVAGKDFQSLALLQYHDGSSTTAASGAGTSRFKDGRFGAVSMVFTQTNIGVAIPTAGRPYRLRPTDSSLIQISSVEDFSDTTEQGFLGSTDFHAIINPDTANRPALLILLF